MENNKPSIKEDEFIIGNKAIDKFYRSTGQHVAIVYRADQMEYHTSWDWLMPVVEKIAKLKIKYSNDSDYYSPYPRTFGMQDDKGNFMVRLNINILFTAPTLIEATWLAVVEFIKFYNQNK